MAVLGTAGLLGIVYSRKRQMTIALVMFCGFVFGPVFPVLIAILLKPMATEVSGRAVGFLFAGASIGWALIPPLIGRIADRTHLERGFLVAVPRRGAKAGGKADVLAVLRRNEIAACCCLSASSPHAAVFIALTSVHGSGSASASCTTLLGESRCLALL